MTPGWPRIAGPCDFKEYKAILDALYERAGRGSFLDLGAGEAHATKDYNGVYVDLVVRPTAPGKTMQFDIREAPERLKQHRFNMALMSDVIEHLTDDDARKLLRELKPLTRSRVIFTPVGPYWMQPEATDPDSHKSAWYPEEFHANGWSVIEHPTYHRFKDGKILGAFWAWKWEAGIQPTAESILLRAGIL